ncbi:MAG: molybdenum cofactor guanylyltransferase MobA [Gammaproteobacteria bacterium]
MPDTTNHELTAIILAGGRGQRMGLQNKGLLPFRQQPLIAHVIASLRPQVSRIVISANDNLDDYQQFGLSVIPDQLADYAGPLAGIYSVMRVLNSEWYITAPCDTPCLPTDYVARMLAGRHGQLACVAHDGQRQQSGCCLLHHSLLGQLEQTLESGHFAVHRFLAEIAASTVDFSDEAHGFANINTPAELAALDTDATSQDSGHD